MCVCGVLYRLPAYEIKGNTILVKCAIGNSKVQLRCKIWPTPKNFGLNKIEATLNGAFLWKKGLWWFNAKSSREFTVDDDVRITAEWHVALRTSTMWLKEIDPRRNQGPFCVEYLALKDEKGTPLVEYSGDRTPWPVSSLEPNFQWQKHSVCRFCHNVFAGTVSLFFNFSSRSFSTIFVLCFSLARDLVS